MANRKVQRKKVQAASKVDAGSLWLAGVGALSLSRRNGAALLGDLIGEGRRLQVEATRLAIEASADVRAQVGGLLKPVKVRAAKQLQAAGMALQSGIGGVLSALGIPSKADVDELSQRVGALSRQLKAR
jgi:poly(hydroxyalkanoate) granule-associated protein